MWPFGRKNVAGRLAAASAPGSPGEGAARPVVVTVLTTIVSPAVVESPLTGARAAVVHIELLEQSPTQEDAYELLGAMVLGDLLTLRDDDGDEISIVVRRARLELGSSRAPPIPLTRVPAELAPLLAKAKGRGVLHYRELGLVASDRLLLTAVVEPTTSVVAVGYRSGTRQAYLARDDVAPVILDEVASAPPEE